MICYNDYIDNLKILYESLRIQHEREINDKWYCRTCRRSKSTVSRYLNGGSVKKETANRIQTIISKHGYEPNLFARLNAKSSKIIGLVVPGFNSVTTPRIVEVIVAYLKENHYNPLILHTDHSTEEEIRSIERLSKMNVDGILVISTGITKQHQKVVESISQPVLFIGQKYEGLKTVVNDDYNAGYAIGQLIAKSGAKSVLGVWVDENDKAVGKERKNGVVDGLAASGVTNVEFVFSSYYYEESVYILENFLEEDKLPDAIICATDRIAQSVYKLFLQSKKVIGKDVSVTGFGDYETSELLNPPLTTVKFDWYNTGRISAETILQMIHDKPVSQLQIIPFELIKRQSVVEKDSWFELFFFNEKNGTVFIFLSKKYWQRIHMVL